MRPQDAPDSSSRLEADHVGIAPDRQPLIGAVEALPGSSVVARSGEKRKTLTAILDIVAESLAPTIRPGATTTSGKTSRMVRAISWWRRRGRGDRRRIGVARTRRDGDAVIGDGAPHMLGHRALGIARNQAEN